MEVSSVHRSKAFYNSIAPYDLHSPNKYLILLGLESQFVIVFKEEEEEEEDKEEEDFCLFTPNWKCLPALFKRKNNYLCWSNFFVGNKPTGGTGIFSYFYLLQIYC